MKGGKGRGNKSGGTNQDQTPGPGAYPSPNASSAKGFKMQKPKKERPGAGSTGNQGGGPGAYDAGRGEALTKPKAAGPAMSKVPRMNNFMRDSGDQGPGAYDAGNSFGADVPTFTFPPSPTKKPQAPSAGPGSYSPERADSVTKQRNNALSFGGQTGREDSPKRDEESPDFGDVGSVGRFYTYPKELPIYTIAERREEVDPRAANPGPGEYAVDSPLTKARSRAAKF